MSMYILIGGRSFKTFLTENYAIALDSCYWFTKNFKQGIEHGIDVLMEILDISESHRKFDEYLTI